MIFSARRASTACKQSEVIAHVRQRMERDVRCRCLVFGIAPHAMRQSRRRTSRRVSRVLCSVLAHRVAAIHLDLPLPAGSSDLPAGSGGPPSIACANRLVSQSILLDLAPGGVYLAAPVTRNAGGLLHRRFTLTGARAPAVCFLWHCPAGHPGLPLTTTLPCGARTFLGEIRRSRRGRPVGSSAAHRMLRVGGTTLEV
jgi:hypothetical protein